MSMGVELHGQDANKAETPDRKTQEELYNFIYFVPHLTTEFSREKMYQQYKTLTSQQLESAWEEKDKADAGSHQPSRKKGKKSRSSANVDRFRAFLQAQGESGEPPERREQQGE